MNQVVVVTGASGGIGSEIVRAFRSSGDIVYGFSRSGVCEDCRNITCDVTDRNEVKLAIDSIIEEQGRIDILISNAGMGVSGSVENTPAEKFKQQFDVNFFGSVHIIQAVLPYMRKARKGRILMTSSFASIVGIPFQSFYSASKASIDNFAFALRCEVREFGIKVSTILPGDTATGFTDARNKTDSNIEGEYVVKARRSVATMEKDERSGMHPSSVAKVFVRVANRRNPPVSVIVGAKYKLLAFLLRFLPKRFANFVIYKMYVGD